MTVRLPSRVLTHFNHSQNWALRGRFPKNVPCPCNELHSSPDDDFSCRPQQRKHEKQVFNVEDAHDASTPRGATSISSACTSSSSSPGTSSKSVSRTPPPTKTPTPSLAKCPSSRQSPCYHSPSLRSQPPNPLTPTPSPAAAAPRSPALSPAPSHLSKGLDRAGDRAEGQPPQDYPQSLEPGEWRDREKGH